MSKKDKKTSKLDKKAFRFSNKDLMTLLMSYARELGVVRDELTAATRIQRERDLYTASLEASNQQMFNRIADLETQLDIHKTLDAAIANVNASMDLGPSDG